MTTTPQVEDDVALYVHIPAPLGEWLEQWADHISDNHDPKERIEAAVAIALYSQKERSKDAVMVPRRGEG